MGLEDGGAQTRGGVVRDVDETDEPVPKHRAVRRPPTVTTNDDCGHHTIVVGEAERRSTRRSEGAPSRAVVRDGGSQSPRTAVPDLKAGPMSAMTLADTTVVSSTSGARATRARATTSSSLQPFGGRRHEREQRRARHRRPRHGGGTGDGGSDVPRTTAHPHLHHRAPARRHRGVGMVNVGCGVQAAPPRYQSWVREQQRLRCAIPVPLRVRGPGTDAPA